MWLKGETYNRLEAYAEGRSVARGGSPMVAACVREAIEHYLVCPQKRQTRPQAEPEPVKKRTRKATTAA